MNDTDWLARLAGRLLCDWRFWAVAIAIPLLFISLDLVTGR